MKTLGLPSIEAHVRAIDQIYQAAADHLEETKQMQEEADQQLEESRQAAKTANATLSDVKRDLRWSKQTSTQILHQSVRIGDLLDDVKEVWLTAEGRCAWLVRMASALLLANIIVVLIGRLT